MKRMLFLLFIFNAIILLGQWSTNPKNTLLLDRTREGDIDYFKLLKTNNKGCSFLGFSGNFFSDDFSSNPLDIVKRVYTYIDFIDANGYLTWDNKIKIGSAHQTLFVKSITDNAGNLIVAYVDKNYQYSIDNIPVYDSRIKIEKITPNGNKPWGRAILLSADSLEQKDYEIINDSDNGFYIYWYQYIGNNTSKFIIQHFNGEGERLWGDNGLVLYEGFVDDFDNDILKAYPDGNGGIITVRYLGNNEFSYLRINENKNILWERNNRGYNTQEELFVDNKGYLITRTFQYNYQGNKSLLDVIDVDGNYLYSSPIDVSNYFVGYSKLKFASLNTDTSLSLFILYKPELISKTVSFYQKFDTLGVQLYEGIGINMSNKSPNDNLVEVIKDNTDYIVMILDSLGWWARKMDSDMNLYWGDVEISRELFSLAKMDSDSKGGLITAFLNLDYVLGIQQISANGNLGEVLIDSYNEENDVTVKKFELSQNYPNPFNPSTKIKFTIAAASLKTVSTPKVTLKIYNILGQQVAVLINKPLKAGSYEVEFNAAGLPSGVYIYKITAGEFTASRKMILLK